MLGIPCITLRHNTERSITCEEGTNQVIGNQKAAILAAAYNVLSGDPPIHPPVLFPKNGMAGPLSGLFRFCWRKNAGFVVRRIRYRRGLVMAKAPRL